MTDVAISIGVADDGAWDLAYSGYKSNVATLSDQTQHHLGELKKPPINDADDISEIYRQLRRGWTAPLS
jgi:hypothetical protein